MSMTDASSGRSRAGLLLGAVAVACHVAANAVSPYGWQRDEFLYFAMGEHLRLWRMDFPPFIALAARAGRAVLGDSLVATRLLPALCHGVLVWLAARTARLLGGGRAAEWLAALGVLTAPLFMRSGSLFQPVIFDQLWWTVALVALLGLGASGNPRWWLGVGAGLGLGLLTKFSIAFLAVPLAVGVLATPLRRWCLTPWPWGAALLAVVIGLPSITGQLLLGFPVAGQMETLQASQLAHVTAAGFLKDQLLFSPVFVPLAVLGLVQLFRRDETRAAAIACLGAVIVLLVLRGKAYYAGPVYPVLFAAGAAWVGRRRVAAWLIGGGAVVIGVLAAPFGYPIVPPERMAAYAAKAGITEAVRTNRGEVLPLPQDYADMLGWEELVREVARVYHALPPSDRERAVVYGQNYGRAGAVDFFRARYGLPRSVSNAGSYWFFGPGTLPGEVLVSVGGERADLETYFEQVEEAGRTRNPWGVPYEQEVVIRVCRRMRGGATLQSVWPSLAGRN